MGEYERKIYNKKKNEEKKTDLIVPKNIRCL